MSKIIVFILTAVVLSFAVPASADRAEVDLSLYGVRSTITGPPGYFQSVDARVGDEVEFSLRMANISSVAARDVRVNVYLPFGMRVVANSLKIDGVLSSNNAVNSGVSVGNIGAGEQKTVTFRALPGGNLEGSYDIQGQISGGNIGTVTKYLTVNILPRPTASTPILSATPSPPATPSRTASIPPVIKTKVVTKTVYTKRENMTIVKVGRNITAEQQLSTKEISAQPDDELEFSIQITSSSGKNIENIVIKDILPEQMHYLFGSVHLDSQMVSDQIFREGLSLGHLRPNEIKIISYRARLSPKNSFPNGKTELKNTSEVKAANANSITDSVRILVNKNNRHLLGGVLALAGFTSYLLILLAALAVLFFTFWMQEKKRSRTIVAKQDFSPSQGQEKTFQV